MCHVRVHVCAYVHACGKMHIDKRRQDRHMQSSLRSFPPPVSTLVCRPGDNYKSRFGQDCVHNYDDVCVSVVKIRDNFFVCM